MEYFSAIVILLDNDVHSVYVVPASVATPDNMERLRTQKNNHRFIAYTSRLRIQRVFISDADHEVKTFEDVSKQLENVLENL